MANNFWFKFYFKEWANDVRPLSLQAKGLLMELIIYMNQNEPFGVIENDVRLISRLSGSLSEEASECINEFKKFAILNFEIFDDGKEYIVSRRIMKEKQKSAQNSLNAKGKGNPMLKKNSDSLKRNESDSLNDSFKRIPNSIFISNSISNLKEKGGVGEKEKSEENEIEIEEPKKRFVKPTIEELQLEFQKQMLKRNLEINPFDEATKFLNYYENKSWRIGSNKTQMKSWSKAVENWCINAKSSTKVSKLPPNTENPFLTIAKNINGTESN